MRSWFLAALIAASACGNEYLYVPATNTGALVAGRPASDVAIPPEAPLGDVRLATFGVADVAVQGTNEPPKVHALHLRMIVANNSDQPWTLDTREERVSLEGRGESRPAYASAEGGSQPPVITIPPGGKRTVDLFFPLPADMSTAGKLAEFDAIWSVQTNTRVVTERTPFERLQVEPDYAYAYDWDYWGPPYWYDPYYLHGAWRGVVLGPAYVARPVIVHRPVILHAPPARMVR